MRGVSLTVNLRAALGLAIILSKYSLQMLIGPMHIVIERASDWND